MQPLHDTPILGMGARPRVQSPVEYGNDASFWVEYPTGLIDVSRSQHLNSLSGEIPPLTEGQLELSVDGDRAVRFSPKSSAIVIIDMQK